MWPCGVGSDLSPTFVVPVSSVVSLIACAVDSGEDNSSIQHAMEEHFVDAVVADNFLHCARKHLLKLSNLELVSALHLTRKRRAGALSSWRVVNRLTVAVRYVTVAYHVTWLITVHAPG